MRNVLDHRRAGVLAGAWLMLCCGGTEPGAAASEEVASVMDAEVAPDPGPTPVVEPDAEPQPEPMRVCPERKRCDGSYCEQTLIPAGEFFMGSDSPPRLDSHFPSGDERPIHRVKLDAFCIDRFEVSLERYESCVDAGVCPPEGLMFKEDGYETVVNHYPPQCWPDREKCKDYAVNGKNYWQAHTYCTWVGGRLCTEAEWERAANGPGPQKRIHPWGDDPPTADLVNIPSVGPGTIEEVYSHAAGTSPEGVFNLAGNVYEWVRDAYQPYEPAPDGEALENPVYPPTTADAKVIGRGSCFFTEPEETVTERSIFWKTFDWG